MKHFYPLLLLPLLAGCPSGKCGDNTQDENEACDDGNTLDADGCEADCSLPACNNGILDPGELCLGEPANFTTDLSPIEPAVADFNGDGHQDIATANSAGQSISILLGDGGGSFARQAEVEVGQFITFVATGDFDGDGNQDLAIPVPDLNRTELFRGAGDGSFTPLEQLTSTNPTRLVVADFNEDGDTDIAASSEDGIDLFLNDGSGGFEAPRISFIGSNPIFVAADFDGDNNLDVAASVGGALVLLLGDGVGNLAPQIAQLDGQIQGDISAADFDGNLLPDIVAAQFSDGTIHILTNEAGVFSIEQTLPALRPVALTTNDLNQDTIPDVAIASDADINLESNLALVTSGEETFSAQDPIFANSGDLKGITTADLNEDTAPDVILTNPSNNQLVIFLSQP